jgi:hypothetical protein
LRHVDAERTRGLEQHSQNVHRIAWRRCRELFGSMGRWETLIGSVAGVLVGRSTQ